MYTFGIQEKKHKNKSIDFNIFRPKASSVKSNLFTCYISLLYYR